MLVVHRLWWYLQACAAHVPKCRALSKRHVLQDFGALSQACCCCTAGLESLAFLECVQMHTSCRLAEMGECRLCASHRGLLGCGGVEQHCSLATGIIIVRQQAQVTAQYNLEGVAVW